MESTKPFFIVVEGKLYAQNKMYMDEEGNPRYLKIDTWKSPITGNGEDLSPERIKRMNSQINFILENRNFSGFHFPENTDPLVLSQFAVFPGKYMVAQNEAANRCVSMDTKNVSYEEMMFAIFSPVQECFLWSEWNYDRNEPR